MVKINLQTNLENAEESIFILHDSVQGWSTETINLSVAIRGSISENSCCIYAVHGWLEAMTHS